VQNSSREEFDPLAGALRLPQELKPERVVRVPLQEPFQDLDALPPLARLEIDPGQRHVRHLESGLLLQQPLQDLHGSPGVATRGQHQRQVVPGFALAGPLVHRLLEITLRGFEITLPAEENA
jgi:hypothetical protein